MTMAIHSRSSLRRHDPPKLPPSKKPRLRQSQPPLVRRRSSPDLLDTTVDCHRHVARPPNSPNPNPNPNPPPPGSAVLRPPPPASSPDTPRHRVLEPSYETPSASAALYLQGDRESPDPLDTITPVTASKQLPKTSAIEPVSSRASPPVGNHAEYPVDIDKRLGDTARTTRKSTSNPPQPAPTTSIDPPPVAGRRSLRSQDAGSRSKCELASYFHNYEELLSLAPPKSEPEPLAGDTTVNLIDDLTSPPSIPSPLDTGSLFGNPLLKLHNCEAINLPEPSTRSRAEDPLSEETYFRPHRRVERQEKQLRNIERERAQHEKLQVDRLLDELKGHDWVRVLGITGISDAEKKLYEPKRGFFIKELSLLVEKFNIWRDEEKRRKLSAKERPFVRAETTPPGAAKSGSKRRGVKNKKPVSEELNGSIISDSQSHGDLPDTDDVDAWAARQLHQEARSASGKYPKPSTEEKRSKKSGRAEPPSESLSSSPSDHQTPTSFAFGYPVPVLGVREFCLPSDILNEETIQASRRKLRRLRRERRTM